jgi:predicted signal transduction protein with EAL and GGDEF domain
MRYGKLLGSHYGDHTRPATVLFEEAITIISAIPRLMFPRVDKTP